MQKDWSRQVALAQKSGGRANHHLASSKVDMTERNISIAMNYYLSAASNCANALGRPDLNMRMIQFATELQGMLNESQEVITVCPTHEIEMDNQGGKYVCSVCQLLEESNQEEPEPTKPTTFNKCTIHDIDMDEIDDVYVCTICQAIAEVRDS